jgi:hypothetical protein
LEILLFGLKINNLLDRDPGPRFWKKRVDGVAVLGYLWGVIMNLNLRLSLNALLAGRAAVEV